MRAELAMEREKLEKLSNTERARKEIDFVKELKTMPICIAQEKANEQHYEVPAEFYRVCLGPCLKYSSGYWPSAGTTLAESEVAMLEMYCERSGIKDGMNIIVSCPCIFFCCIHNSDAILFHYVIPSLMLICFIFCFTPGPRMRLGLRVSVHGG
jgi:hypothetical protein